MKWERAGLLAFFGNFLINTLIAGTLVALMPTTATKDITSPQYIMYAVVSALFIAVLTWWFLYKSHSHNTLADGAIFGALGFIISLLSTFISGISNVLFQTGSFAQVPGIIPSFGSLLDSVTTLVLLGVWVIPSSLIGFLALSSKKEKVRHQS